MFAWTRVLIQCSVAPCFLGWLASAIRLSQDATQQRVALVLRGESFRDRRFFSETKFTNMQMMNYRSHLEKLIIPFENAGYQVDVFTVTFSTPYDEDIKQVFGHRLKVFKALDWDGFDWDGESDQAVNAVDNLRAFQEYANETGKEYRFMVLARHDARFLQDLKQAILSRPSPDNTTLLLGRHTLTDPNTMSVGAYMRCKSLNTYWWFVADRSSISWWSGDELQVVPWNFVPALRGLLQAPTINPKAPNPRWPFECWEELGPLVGGEEHIGFLEEDIMTTCRVYGKPPPQCDTEGV